MASLGFRELPGKRFVYEHSAIGALALWPERSEVVRIAQMHDEPDPDDPFFGSVTVVHTTSNLIVGETCISKLRPVRELTGDDNDVDDLDDLDDLDQS
jgi:hypothetical protein